MAQFARPNGDVANTASFSPTPLWEQVDDPVGSGDSSTITTNNGNTSGQYCILETTNVTDPGVNTGFVLRGRARKSAASGKNIQFNVQFLDATNNQIGTFGIAADTTETLTTYNRSLTESEAATLRGDSDWPNGIRFKISKIVSGGGASRELIVADVELEVPDVSGTTYYQTLNATAPATAAVGRVITYVKTLLATAAAVAQYGSFRTRKTLNATAPATAAMLRKTSKTLLATAPAQAAILKRTWTLLNATAVANASLTTASVFSKTLNATAPAQAAIQLKVTYAKLLNAVATALAVLSTRSDFFRTLNATAGATAAIVKKTSITLLANALATATEIHSVTYNVSLNASAQAIAQTLKMPQAVINASASALANLNTQYIPGGGGQLRRFWLTVLKHLLGPTQPV